MAIIILHKIVRRGGISFAYKLVVHDFCKLPVIIFKVIAVSLIHLVLSINNITLNLLFLTSTLPTLPFGTAITRGHDDSPPKISIHLIVGL